MRASEGSTKMLETFVSPFFMFVFCIIFLAAINKSVGVRRTYVQLLLKLFEYGRLNIEKARKGRNNGDNGDDTTPEDDDDSKTDDVSAKSEHRGTSRSDTLNDLQISNGNSLISREAPILLPDGDTKTNSVPNAEVKEVEKNVADKQNEKEDEITFNLAKCLDYVKSGVEAIIEDEVTSRFEAEDLKSWNLLTRTNRYYEFISWRMSIMWMCGFFMRYFILMPLRVFICFIGVALAVLMNGLVANIPNRKIRQFFAGAMYKLTFRLFTRSLSALITFHNEENKPKNCGFCVANHTSPIDVAILSTENVFSLIGQRHGGFLGVLQRALGRASPHIWFERAEAKDRHAVAQRLRDHVSDPRNPPILIFPEGTCINNTSVMQFKKGSFEVGGVIYPVAIKYDPRFGDAFWNSSKYSMMQYLYMMMTSWAIVCDVWYLPPMYREEGESAIDFANRVKSVIAKQGGLVDLVWDGQLKRMKPKKEWKEKQQVEFTKRLKGE